MLSNLTCLLLQKFLSPKVLLDFGWRLVLPLAAVLGWIVCHMRERLKETKPFLVVEASHHTLHSPFKTVLKEEKEKTIFGFLVSVFEVVSFSVLSVLPYLYAKKPFYLPGISIICLQLSSALLSIILLPVIGYLSTKYRSLPWLKIGVLGTIGLSFLLYWLLLSGNLAFSLIIYFLLLFLFSIHAAILPSILASLFPVRVRYTGIAFSFNICDGILWSLVTNACFLMIPKGGPLFLIFLPISAVVFLITLWVFKNKNRRIANHLR